MPSKYKPTRDRKQHRAPKKSNAVRPEELGNTPSAENLPPVDPNAEIIIPFTKAEKEEKRRIELREEIREGQPKMSSKKQKRLNKYIENKLKKEERVDLMQKLSETKVDTSLFRSTKTMGAAKESKREQIRRALLEEKFGINMEENAKILYEERDPEKLELVEISQTMEGITGSVSGKTNEARELDQVAIEIPGNKSIAIGSGLKRPLESDANGQPIVKKIRKSREVREERLMAIVEAMERQKEQDAGDSSIDEDEDEQETDYDSGKEDNDDVEEEWGGIPDSPISEGADETEGAAIDTDEVISNGNDLRDTDEDGEKDDEDSGGDDDNDDDQEEEEEEENELVPRLKRGRSEKANAFKEWALAQRRQVMNDGDPLDTDTSMPNLLALKPGAPHVHVHVLRTREEDMTPPPELQVPTVEREAYYVTVDRPAWVQAARLGLPVVAEEQRIMEAIHNNPCVVICGETGSGKTTQVPQFLYEAGYGSPGSKTPGLIGVTQPRRVAAVSMAKRVGDELGTGGSDKVAYQIRFEGTANPKTAIKFMTDGVLLRELAEDFLLRKYSAIIIDEAHERSINTDILIGVMSRVLKLREQMRQDGVTKPLKLVIMSATLRVSDFTQNKQLFPQPPPLLKAEARQHPVTVHFSRRTPSDYAEETFKKVCKIHRRLPLGGILVFLTGQNEITALLRRLQTTFPFKRTKTKYGTTVYQEEKSALSVSISAGEAAVETEDVEFGGLSKSDPDESDADSILDEDDEDLGEGMATTDTNAPLHVLPLYSLLPTKDQLRVFEEAPEGSRLCILATNVAETSLTIPGIRYVVDCGRSKERNFDKTTGVQSFDIGWISKASAMQRAGRSGRTGPGHCYKLYSSAVYERDFPEFAEAEILRMPIEGVVLQMKSMNIDTIVNFPFPTAPDRPSLKKAETLLGFLGALDPKKNLTNLGRTMNIFPLSPRFSKILIIGQQHGCLPYIIAIVAALSVGEIFIPEHQLDINDPDEEENNPPNNETMIERNRRANRRKAYYRAHRNCSSLDPTSDALKLLSVVCSYEYEKRPAEFCEHNFVRLKGMQETHKLRRQITNIVRANCPGVLGLFEAKIPPPSILQVKAIKQIVAVGFIDQVAIRADLVPNSTFKLGQSSLKKVTDVPYMTLFASSTTHQSEPGPDLQDVAVYIHPSSILASQSSYPEYLVYSELKKSMSTTGKVRMRPLTSVTGSQLATLAKGTPLITYSKPLDHVPPKILPGTLSSRRECWVIPRIGGAIGKSELGWPLPARKVVQRRENGKWEIC